ncbi:amidase family protein [Actinomadura parmotrematis]|uniref:Amidase n=1 Tax=Actinomadura parmotrematis TaxID=2864039 RepID=A0ABS7FUL0_9ACTN|nr:amidase family protein [Actinomadura parmotrematis]MBW8483203.1 amidase [Actinomadura parmotrematis]
MNREPARRLFLARNGVAAGPAPVAVPARPRVAVLPASVRLRPEALEDPAEATLAEAAWLIREGLLTPASLVAAYLARIDAHDNLYQAYAEVLADEARAAAARPAEGPLAGLPMVAGDSFAAERLRAAGAIVLGTASTTTANAWAPINPARDAGTACAVAARLAVAGVGTARTGGVLPPALRQNLTAIRPTMGRSLAHGRDVAGPLARDAMDAAMVLSVLAGPDPHDPRTLGLPPLPDLVRAATPIRRAKRVRLRRPTWIGVPADYPRTPAHKEFLATLERIGGVRLREVAYPQGWDLLSGPFTDGRPAERAKAHLLRELLLEGALESCDLLLQPGPTPFAALGLPEAAFPIGFDATGMPVGTILGGGPYEEDRLLEVVAAYQAETSWHLRRPADPPQIMRAPARGPLTAVRSA